MKTLLGLFVLACLAPAVAALSTSAADPFQPIPDPFQPPARKAVPDHNADDPFADPFGPARPFEAAKPAPPKPVVKLQPKGERVDVRKALDSQTEFEFIETPLSEVAEYISDRHKIDVELDTRALEDDGIGTDTPVLINLRGVSLRSALRIMLQSLGLTYTVRDEALVITTPAIAEGQLITRVYPVADLVRSKDTETGEVMDDYDTLIELITTVVRPDSWDFSGPPPIPKVLGTVIIVQTEDIHNEIAQFLAGLRRLREQFEQDQTTVATVSLYLTTDELTNRIRKQLQERITIQARGAPLSEVAQALADRLELPITIDQRALDDEGISSQTPVTADLQGVRAELALNRLLRPYRLTWVQRDQVVEITTEAAAEGALSTRIYPIYDLVGSARAGESPDWESHYVTVALGRGGRPCTIQEWWMPPALVVSETEAVHKILETMLTDLRTGASQAKAQEPSTVQQGLSRMETRIYMLPRDDKGNFTLDAERVAKWIETHLVAAEPGPPAAEVYVNVLGPGTLVIKQTAAVHREIQSQLNIIGLRAGPRGTPFSGGFF